MNFFIKIILTVKYHWAISRSLRIEKQTNKAAKRAKRIAELVTEIQYLTDQLKNSES